VVVVVVAAAVGVEERSIKKGKSSPLGEIFSLFIHVALFIAQKRRKRAREVVK
jgi:hypothetical protein